MKARDLLDQAAILAKRSPKKPRQADLKRAVSATYYAVFHCLCRLNADSLIGVGAARSDKAWIQTYRAIDHGLAKKRCRSAQDKNFPDAIKNFAAAFVSLQELRHRADYDPLHSFTKSEVLNFVDTARSAVSDIEKVNLRDRRAFAVWILLGQREL